MNWEFVAWLGGIVPIVLGCLQKIVSTVQGALKIRQLWSRLEDDKKAAGFIAQQEKIVDYQKSLEEPLRILKRARTAFVLIAVIAIVLLWPSWSASSRIDHLSDRVTNLESEVASLKTEIKRLEGINEQQKRDLEKSLIIEPDIVNGKSSGVDTIGA